ncbi:unnamed protein product [Closterium sp. Naga37s-1]|nr:unnamed protein product [Closterium sp. Naga37s-1]
MTADGAWRWAEDGEQIGKSKKTSRTTRSDASEARLGGSGGATEKDEKGAGEGDHRTAPEQKEEVSSEGSKSGIARNVLLCKEIDNGKIKKGTREIAKKTRGEARVQLELGGCGNMERDRAGLERLVRGWNERCTGSVQEAEEKKESSGGLLCQIGEDLGAGIWGDEEEEDPTVLFLERLTSH